ncbi:hypothetical protein GCM10007036_21310 [Alsobacter metallidurans]|uniref:Uncharacterized protein n=1 Tax=Alsobacter metallidurans TaxID=340221 RepID=A0A917I6R6_9HYPH|nr:hypothetical protein [Alsobacter metallidurans]GGH18854.1 hypothetical protein GCM10007036_21310 [Alsobacter metallidurans]
MVKKTEERADSAAAGKRVTYYVALPFTRDAEGELAAGEAAEFQSPGAAMQAANALSKKHGGAVAFSRSGDPSIGEFDDAVVLIRVGDVPADLESFTS